MAEPTVTDDSPSVEPAVITTDTKDFLGRALVNIGVDARDHIGRAIQTGDKDWIGRDTVA